MSVRTDFWKGVPGGVDSDDSGPVRPPRQRLPALGVERRRRRVPGRARSLSPVRITGLPVGEPDRHGARAEGPRGRRRRVRRRSDPRYQGLGVPRGPGRDRRSDQRLRVSLGGLPALVPRLRRSLQRPGPVGPRDRPDHQQRVVGHHRDARRRVRRMGRASRASTSIPPQLRAEIDGINEWVYSGLNNGVYRVGFAASQAAYDEAIGPLFDTLDRMDALLAERRYLAGSQHTLADWRAFPTLMRFDLVYHGLFRVQPPAPDRLRQPLALPARPLPDPARRRRRSTSTTSSAATT